MSRHLTPLLVVAGLVIPGEATPAEGALSHYLPGTPGDILLALPQEPGLQFANVSWVQSGSVNSAVLQGQLSVGLDVTTVLDIVAAFYTFEREVLGATVTTGAAIPFGHARLEADIVGPLGQRISADETSFNLSDIAITPVALNWASGPWSVEIGETVFAPTGAYQVDNTVNLGRNYWSFDTYAAVTWFDPGTGTEASVQPGVMVNTRNEATDYRTGTEFHVDFVANQFLSETFAVGLRGYYYRQLTGDSGSGALLGDFKSESLGLGAGFLWTPAFADGALSITARAMTDVHAKNRFDSTYGQLTIGWKF